MRIRRQGHLGVEYPQCDFDHPGIRLWARKEETRAALPAEAANRPVGCPVVHQGVLTPNPTERLARNTGERRMLGTVELPAHPAMAMSDTLPKFAYLENDGSAEATPWVGIRHGLSCKVPRALLQGHGLAESTAGLRQVVLLLTDGQCEGQAEAPGAADSWLRGIAARDHLRVYLVPFKQAGKSADDVVTAGLWDYVRRTLPRGEQVQKERFAVSSGDASRIIEVFAKFLADSRGYALPTLEQISEGRTFENALRVSVLRIEGLAAGPQQPGWERRQGRGHEQPSQPPEPRERSSELRLPPAALAAGQPGAGDRSGAGGGHRRGRADGSALALVWGARGRDRDDHALAGGVLVRALRRLPAGPRRGLDALEGLETAGLSAAEIARAGWVELRLFGPTSLWPIVPLEDRIAVAFLVHALGWGAALLGLYALLAWLMGSLGRELGATPEGTRRWYRDGLLDRSRRG